MRIADLRSWRTASGGTQVECDVDGEALWFASDDAALAASPEAFASALLIPAATRGEPLEITAPLDRSWLERVSVILERAREWWQLPGTRVIATDVTDNPRARPGTIGQCFTGGVDSFHALIYAQTPPAVLVYAQGYERNRLVDAFLPGFREIAAAFGARAVLISTNLRRHSALRGIDWDKSHGGALAALGHVLSEEIERLVIPSSYPYHDSKPWGSHWELDHLWSSRRLAVEHADATLRRDGKVRAIADRKMVQRHLHVCFDPQTGNCSRCEKCVRTMISLAMCGRLYDCETFDHTRPLERRVDNLPVLKPHLISIYEDLLRGIDDPRLKSAVERLITHSRGRPAWWFKRVRRRRRSIKTRKHDGPTRRVRRTIQEMARRTPAPLRHLAKQTLVPTRFLQWLYPGGLDSR